MVMLASRWDGSDPTGWWLSEKLDGVRALWDGKRLTSRMGNEFRAPKELKERLPPYPLDGELWMGRGSFSKTLSIVKSRGLTTWKGVSYYVFDSPGPEIFEKRLMRAAQWVIKDGPFAPNKPMKLVDLKPCISRDHLNSELHRIVQGGGEGLMLRRPNSLYEDRRSTSLLKVKPFQDAEAVVLGYTHSDRREFRALHCRLLEDPSVEFDVGSGLTSSDLRDPPAIGSVITFKYYGSVGRAPRHPVFLRRFAHI